MSDAGRVLVALGESASAHHALQVSLKRAARAEDDVAVSTIRRPPLVF
jgi:hypothetical protein